MGKTKIQSQFLILHLHCWYNKKFKHAKVTNNNNSNNDDNNNNNNNNSNNNNDNHKETMT